MIYYMARELVTNAIAQCHYSNMWANHTWCLIACVATRQSDALFRRMSDYLPSVDFYLFITVFILWLT